MSITADDLRRICEASIARWETAERERDRYRLLHSEASTSLVELEAERDEARAECERLREALDHYACMGLGRCTEVRLKDGTCVRMATDGMCGDVAHAALTRSR